jgi:hypothetical protein
MLVRLTGNKMEKKINYIPAVLSLKQKKVGMVTLQNMHKAATFG